MTPSFRGSLFALVALGALPLFAVEYPPIPRVLPAPTAAAPDPAVAEPLLKEALSFNDRLAALRKKEPELAADVEVFFKAVRYALEIGEFWDPKDINKVRPLLDEGIKRLAALEKGEAYWTTQHGSVVRGFYFRHRWFPAALRPGDSRRLDPCGSQEGEIRRRGPAPLDLAPRSRRQGDRPPLHQRPDEPQGTIPTGRRDRRPSVGPAVHRLERAR